ncbi:hypothetical protein [Pseudoalteromonas rubra]|uniref:hypothetical protein n=1 Tax=Pseudoalteromonas rubra TaxID=43658 RepID=UPI000F767E38|nr:hypothetical protein [Pseudoalteromonas rubra]
MLETFLSVAGVGLGTHSVVGGVTLGKKVDIVLQNLKKLDVKIEKLSSGLLYADTVSHIKELERKNQELITNTEFIKEILIPLQKQANQPVLASSHIKMPSALQVALNQNPWEVMFDVRPLNRVQSAPDLESVPILFNDGGVYYVGWQKKGVFPSLFGCEFDGNGFYLPSNRKQKSKNHDYTESSSGFKNCELVASNLPESKSLIWVPRKRNVDRERFLMNFTNRADYEV